MAEESLQLVPLSCESCGSMLQSEGREVVFRCANCGQGYALVEGELGKVKLGYAVPKIQEPGREIEYHPFWVLRTKVRIDSRSATGGFFSSILGKGGRTEGAISFYVPGFDAPLQTLRELGMAFTKSGFSYEATEAKGRTIGGCVHSEQFAKGFADFILLSLEAEKPDKMRSISYSIDFTDSEILAVPFVSLNGRKKDLLIGNEVGGW